MNELESLREAVRGLLTKQPTWERLCKEIGVAGLTVPAHLSGAGAGLAEACAVLEECGRVLSDLPMLSTTLAVQALLRTGNEEACARLLPGIAEGTTRVALVWPGLAPAVLDGTSADAILVPDGDSLFEAGRFTATAVESMDVNRHFAQIETGDLTRLGGFDAQRMRDTACVLLAAEQVGAAERALEITVEYAKTRVQFGRPIGGFQALQHRMADLHVQVQTARSAYLAGLDGSPASAAVAKVHCSEVFQRVAAEMIQIHGGIGITWEHPAHHYFKRAHGTAELLGHPRTHVARLWDETIGGAVLP